MSKASLKFWKNGEPFEPVVYLEDIANYEDAEDEARKAVAPKRPAHEVVKAQAEFLRRILEQTFPGEKADMRLTVAQVRGGFIELWTKGQDWREADRPLGEGGAPSAPSSSPVSA